MAQIARPGHWLRRPPPGVTFAGFLGPRPAAGRSTAEIQAEVRRLFAQAPANDNQPLDGADTPPE